MQVSSRNPTGLENLMQMAEMPETPAPEDIVVLSGARGGGKSKGRRIPAPLNAHKQHDDAAAQRASHQQPAG